MTYTNGQIWRGIEILAERHNWSLAELAVRAGLDPTALNRSKRLSQVGKPRWPSTSTLAKVLKASEVTFQDFSRLI
jgi:phage repressor protein C with HTH and peptisase S24 domain